MWSFFVGSPTFFGGPVFGPCDLSGIVTLFYLFTFLIFLGLVATIVLSHRAYRESSKGNPRQLWGVLLVIQYLAALTVIEPVSVLLFLLGGSACGAAPLAFICSALLVILLFVLLNNVVFQSKKALNKKGVGVLVILALFVSLSMYALTGKLLDPQNTDRAYPWWIRPIKTYIDQESSQYPR